MKMIIKSLLYSVLLLSFVCGCGQSKNNLGTDIATEKDIAAILELQKQFPSAHAYEDGAKLAEFYTDDAMIIPPGEPLVRGRQAISEWYKIQFNKAAPIENPKVIVEEIEVFGNLAFNRGNFILKFEGETPDEPVVLKLRFVTIWRKLPDGSWKFYRDIWNTEALTPPEEQVSMPSFQFELVQAENPARFSGEAYQVGWIKIFLPDKKPYVQMIPVQMDEPATNWTQWGMKMEDVNFDGYPDIGVHQHGGAKWGRLHWYLYDPVKKEFYTDSLTKELSNLILASFKTDPSAKRIIITNFHGMDLKEYSYQIINGRLRLFESTKLDSETNF